MYSKDEIISLLYLPFRILSKKELSISEYINVFSFRLNKAPPSKIKPLVDLAIKNQLLKFRKKRLLPTSDSEKEVNFDFNIEEVFSFLNKEKNKPILIRVAEVMAKKLEMSVKEVIAKINTRQKQYGSLMPPEVVALSIAEEENIDIGDLKSLVTNKGKIRL